ncbi:MAG: hypothetical protein ACR2HR_02335 [Euzebya sp.]
MTRFEHTPMDEGFEDRLQTLLHAAADPISPDPGRWRILQQRINRRRRGWQVGGLALAGAAVALIAVVVLPGTGQDVVEFAPGDVGSGPPATPASATPGPARDPEAGPAPLDVAAISDAGAIVFSDGDSIHVADLDGQILWTPALGEGTSTQTDVVVRDGGTTADFTMAYRYVPTGQGQDCGDISWSRVVGPDNNIAGGGLPGVDTSTSGDCLGAPVFASDGSALAWLAQTAAGDVALQVLDWTEEGPVEGSLQSITLDVSSLVDPVVVQWDVAPAGGDTAGSGALTVRAGNLEGAGLFTLPTVRTAAGAVLVPPVPPDPSVITTADPAVGRLLDVDGDWALGRPTAAFSDDEVPDDREVWITRQVPGVSGPETVANLSSSEVAWSPGDLLYLDALGNTAVFGDGRSIQLVVLEPGVGSQLTSSLPPAVSAALLVGSVTGGPVPGQGTPPVPNASAPPTPVPPSSPATAQPEPTPTPGGTASITNYGVPGPESP